MTDTFGDPTVAVNYMQNLIDHGFVGELFYGDLSAIGGETTGSGIELSDGSMLEIELHNDPLLVSLAEELDGQARTKAYQQTIGSSGTHAKEFEHGRKFC